MRTLFALLVAMIVVGPALAETVVIPADRDSTLFEHSNGALGSGAGPAVFAGRNNAIDNSVRRALLHFDLSSELPTDGTILVEKVALVLTNRTASNVAPREYRVHRLLADWGEGDSTSTGGGGAPAAEGDATWLHSYYPKEFWLHNGAQFAGEPSARLVVAGPGSYRWDGPELMRDVVDWVKRPQRNFGWILIGDETEGQTSRAFGSREDPDPAVWPAIEVTFRKIARPRVSGAIAPR